MTPPELNSALQAEYLHLQKTVEDFDSKALTIKAWSITFSLTVIGGAFVSHKELVFLLASVASAIFWYLETMWKVFQLGYYARIKQIESHFRDARQQKFPHQIYVTWVRRWKKTPWAEVRRMSLWPHIALPHAFAMLLGIVLFCFARAGFI